MPLALRVALVSFASFALVVACGASNNRNFRLGTGSHSCLDVDSDCTDSHDCCTQFCANGTCVRREK
jgi:hypothetical protein